MTLVIESVFTLCIRNPELQTPLYSIYLVNIPGPAVLILTLKYRQCRVIFVSSRILSGRFTERITGPMSCKQHYCHSKICT